MAKIYGGAELEEAPIVRLAGGSRAKRFKFNVKWVSDKKAHILHAFSATKGAAKARAGSDPAYIGCLWRDDNSLALFAVDHVDKGVKLHWEPEDLFVRYLEQEGSVVEEVKTKDRPRVRSFANRASLPKRASVVQVKGNQAPESGAELIRRMRSVRGLSRSELAERLEVAPSRIAELESGQGTQGPTLGLLARVAEACELNLNVSLEPND